MNFSKLMDPFESRKSRITVRFNGEKIIIPFFNELLFENAHADLEAKFDFDEDDKPYLSGKVNYRRRYKENYFRVKAEDLVSIANANSIGTLRSLGPFKVRLYWYNRQILTAIEGIGEKKQVKKLVEQWAGGLMLYRDGFRVNPYGNPEDDWLGLDKKALAASGYKVNRHQIIGKVDITSRHNPKLVDQTNREGLQECREKKIFVLLLQHLIGREFKAFLDLVDKEIQAKEPITFNEIEGKRRKPGEEDRR